MEMRILCELGRWILDEPGLKQRWGETLWHEAFEPLMLGRRPGQLRKSARNLTR